jgi:hypothetical protein
MIFEKPLWIRCECCDDFICTKHQKHVADCDCKTFEEFILSGIDPYFQGGYYANQTPSGQNKLGPSEDRWKIRSKTYQGIADAMADQWSYL